MLEDKTINFEKNIFKISLFYSVGYIGSLCLIALLVGGSFYQFHIMSQARTQLNDVSHILSRQNTLAQNITLRSSEFLLAAPEARDAIKRDISTTVSEILANNKDITRGNAEKGLPSQHSEAMDELLFSDPVYLDERVRQFVRFVQDLVTAPDYMLDLSNPNYKLIKEAAQTTLFEALEAVRSQSRKDVEAKISAIQQTMILLFAGIIGVLIMLGALVFRPLLRSMIAQKRDLFDLAMTDPLTGCHNRRSFVLLAEREFDRVGRFGTASCVLTLDIDKFKTINDTYGHAVGDEVIKDIVATIIPQLRATDFLGRTGGEEFFIVLTETSIDDALFVAEKLRKSIEARVVPTGDGNISYTASFGLAQINEEDDGIHHTMERADEALYQSKENGRNRVSVHHKNTADSAVS